MNSRVTCTGSLGIVLAGLVASVSHGQCVTRDFEELPLGSIVTSPYPGVSFSAEPDTCGGTVDVFVASPPAGTSSGSKCLTVELGCPDFSPEGIWIRFTNPQRYVTFTVGTSVSFEVEVRAYNSEFGGAQIGSTQTVNTSETVNGLIRVGSETGTENIRRIEVQAVFADIEFIDDLSYDFDSTPPEATITEPEFLQCICGDDLFSVRGTACDSDGAYGNDVLEYLPVNAPDGTPWTFIANAFAPLCGTGLLYPVDASTLPSGTLYLRLTVTNACGLTDTAVTTVRIDRSPPGINIQSPAPDSSICGVVEFCGAISDACPVNWSIKAVPLAGGDSILVAEGAGSPCGQLATWNTASVPAGDYEIDVTAVDSCGQSSTTTFDVSLAEGCEYDVDGDGIVGFTDLLLIIANWTF